MLKNGLFREINGCIATGKEANVYQACNESGQDLAIKVYKTSILVFKDRERYVKGDVRFKRYSKHNPRQMVRVWAEKEMRNLMRIHQSGIPCPKPIQLKLHILVMDFIGKDGQHAPRLKDAKLAPDDLEDCYYSLKKIIWRMYRKCRLVHADLSEYNILYFEGECYIIDVSQSVDQDHPKALDFLKEDIIHVNNFFSHKGINVLSLRDIFDYIVDPNVTDDNYVQVLDELRKRLDTQERI